MGHNNCTETTMQSEAQMEGAGYNPHNTKLKESGKKWSKSIFNLKGTLPRKSTWALNVQFSEKTTMVPFIWM